MYKKIINKKNKGDALLEALIATALFGVLSYGVGFSLSKNSSAQREANIQNLAVKQIREDLNTFPDNSNTDKYNSGVMRGCSDNVDELKSTLMQNFEILKDNTKITQSSTTSNSDSVKLTGVNKKCLVKEYTVSIKDSTGVVISKVVKLPTVAYNIDDDLIKNSGDVGQVDNSTTQQ